MTNKEAARRSLCSLVEHVFDHRDRPIRPLYYSELAQKIGRLNTAGKGWGHGMGDVLSIMGQLLKNAKGVWGESIPQIDSLVVNKNGPLKGLPDDGIKEFWPDYPKLTKTEKLNRTRTEHRRIVEFGSRWSDVLRHLGFSETNIVKEETNLSLAAVRGCGESEDHRRLKKFIRDNPEIVGASRDWKSILEYALPSFDLIDVVFKSADSLIAVEVKSTISDGFVWDYERGLFQTVKYHALLSAMAHSGRYDVPPRIKTILVLESRLPGELRGLAAVLACNSHQPDDTKPPDRR
jgi:hypothetical protein